MYLDGLVSFSDIISTHAPARGATSVRDIHMCPCGISTHAPARGATGAADVELMFYDISTHAPARGATKPELYDSNGYVFQPTLPRGERLFGD